MWTHRQIQPRLRQASVETGSGQRLDTTTRNRSLSRLLRYKPRLLGHRLLELQTQRWVVSIDLPVSNLPHMYFRYDRDRVWVWTKNIRQAHMFHNRRLAELAVHECCLKQRFDCRVRRVL